METHSPGMVPPAARRRGLTVAVVVSLVVVVGLGVVMMLGDSHDTSPWVQGGVVVVGFLLLLAGGMAVGRGRSVTRRQAESRTELT